MSASTSEMQELADQILAALGQRLQSGQIVIHMHRSAVQGVEVNHVFRPVPPLLALRRPLFAPDPEPEP
jgi:hypothetical protein